MTIATIFNTASFKLWQKLTKALPLGPILPNIIPGLKTKTQHVMNQLRYVQRPIKLYKCMSRFHSQPLTHGCRENNNPQDVHAFAVARWRLHDDVRGWREVQGEVLYICAVVVLDAVDVDSSRCRLIYELSHCWFRDEFWDSLGSILETKTEQSDHSKHGTNRAVAACDSWFSHHIDMRGLTHLEVLTCRWRFALQINNTDASLISVSWKWSSSWRMICIV